MQIHYETRLKSLEQPFVHLHLFIGDDHHIIEINDAQEMPCNSHLSCNRIHYGLLGTDGLGFKFQADRMGFTLGDSISLHPDMIQTGNVRHCNYKCSTLVIRTLDPDGGRILNIRSTFNNRLVETSIPVYNNQDFSATRKILKTIRDALIYAYGQWFDICIQMQYLDGIYPLRPLSPLWPTNILHDRKSKQSGPIGTTETIKDSLKIDSI